MKNNPNKYRPIDPEEKRESFTWIKNEISLILDKNSLWNSNIEKFWHIKLIQEKIDSNLNNPNIEEVDLYSNFLSLSTLDSLNIWFNRLN